MMASPLKTLFFGSSAYCLPLLEALQQHTNLAGIITREDKPVGRKKILTPSPPRQFGQKANISVLTPRDKKELSNMKDILMELQTDIAVVADYGLIIPQEIFTLPRLQTVNVHFSKLPDLRGASPVQFTILRGDSTAWITIQRMAVTLDTGDIVRQQDYPLSGKETTGELYTKLFNNAGKIISEVLNRFALGSLSSIPQEHTHATFTRKLSKEDGFIPYELFQLAYTEKQATEEQLSSWPLYVSIVKALQPTTYTLQQRLYAAFRALNPWPGLWTEAIVATEKKRLKILDVHLETPETIRINHVQIEGRKPISWPLFHNSIPHNERTII